MNLRPYRKNGVRGTSHTKHTLIHKLMINKCEHICAAYWNVVCVHGWKLWGSLNDREGMVEGGQTWWRNIGSLIALPPSARPDTPLCAVPSQPPLPKLTHTNKTFFFLFKESITMTYKINSCTWPLYTSPNLVFIFLKFTYTRIQHPTVTMLILLSISTYSTSYLKYEANNSKNCDKYILSTLCIASYVCS